MNRRITRLLTAAAFCVVAHASAHAQTPGPFLFTVTAPDQHHDAADVRADIVVGERALVLTNRGLFDPGLSVEARMRPNVLVRSTSGAVEFPSAGYRYRSFNQLELLRPVALGGRSALAVGGGVRQEWDGTRTYLGRVVAATNLGGGRIEGNGVVEKTVAAGRDRMDVIATVGWSHPIGNQVGLGIEGIGQDLEGFWESDEAEGGGHLLVGPSLRVASAGKRWSFRIAGGPLIRSRSSVPAVDPSRELSAVPLRGSYAVLSTFTCTFASK